MLYVISLPWCVVGKAYRCCNLHTHIILCTQCPLHFIYRTKSWFAIYKRRFFRLDSVVRITAIRTRWQEVNNKTINLTFSVKFPIDAKNTHNVYYTIYLKFHVEKNCYNRHAIKNHSDTTFFCFHIDNSYIAGHHYSDH